MLAAALLSLIAWAVLLAARGGFWRADRRLPEHPRPPADWPEVVALIPARDEAGSVRAVLESHAQSEYPGRFSVVLIDDGSTDGTGAIACAVAEAAARPIHVIPAEPLSAGWTGKLWALECGWRALDELAPRAAYVLLTDADIVHAPDALGRLVAHAEGGRLALVSLMARLDARGFWGALLIPAFVFFFQKLYPFAWVNDPARRTAAAAGGCALVSREALVEMGGFAPIRGAIIDDCALAARVKAGPLRRPIWLGLADAEVVSLRDNRRLGTIWRMVARSAFAQIGHSVLLLVATLIGLALAYLAGPLAVLTAPVHGDAVAAALGGAAWTLSALAYVPTLRLYRLPAWQAAGLPLAALLYGAMTFDSAHAHWRGRGGAWKGRVYGRTEGKVKKN